MTRTLRFFSWVVLFVLLSLLISVALTWTPWY